MSEGNPSDDSSIESELLEKHSKLEYYKHWIYIIFKVAFILSVGALAFYLFYIGGNIAKDLPETISKNRSEVVIRLDKVIDKGIDICVASSKKELQKTGKNQLKNEEERCENTNSLVKVIETLMSSIWPLISTVTLLFVFGFAMLVSVAKVGLHMAGAKEDGSNGELIEMPILEFVKVLVTQVKNIWRS